MTANPLVGLQFDSIRSSPTAANFCPPSWPPSRDFPVSIDAKDNVVSRVGDPIWNLGPLAGRSLTINFGDGQTCKGAKIDRENADLFRLVTSWWLWGRYAVRSPASLAHRHDRLKPMFIACSQARIRATDISRFPKVIEALAVRLGRTRGNSTIALLNDLWLVRDELGFSLLGEQALKLLARLAPNEESTQTAYIPPRIWTYQVGRLRQCLDDYLAHRDSVEQCYRFTVDAYATNAGGSLVAANDGLTNGQLPFQPMNFGMKNSDHRRFYGPFALTLQRFGIDQLLQRWLNVSSRAGVKALTTYLTMIERVGLAYALNFSLMRISEGSLLRAGCYSIERDEIGEDIHLLGGVTTKTIEDHDARWIVSPSVKSAIHAMESVARLRIGVGAQDSRRNLTDFDVANPHLQEWAYEPWSSHEPKFSRVNPPSYGEFVRLWPKLFDLDQLRITESDLAIAKKMTFGLDDAKYGIGKVWPLAWHQLRRTGAVNMLASGLVSDASLQYQLKHAARAMSRYYGQNYMRLQAHLDLETRGFFLREMYQALAREFEMLSSDRFVSPHGEKRKAQILAPISEKDHRGLVADAKAGRVSYRETLLGGCAKAGDPCPLGGISNIGGCMGHGVNPACADVLLDRQKRMRIVRLRDSLLARCSLEQKESRKHAALQAQLESAERALHVLDQT